MTDLDGIPLPEALRRLSGKLVSRGFEMVRTKQGGGNFYADYRLEGLTVALVCERGGWSVEIDSPDGQGYGVDVWQSVLGEAATPRDQLSVDQQAAFVEGHIDALLALVRAGGESLGSRLFEVNAWKLSAQLVDAYPSALDFSALRTELAAAGVDPSTHAIMQEPGGARFHFYHDGGRFVVAYRHEGSVEWQKRFAFASEACAFFLRAVLGDSGQT